MANVVDIVVKGKDQFSPTAKSAQRSAGGLKGAMGGLGKTALGVGAGFVAAQASIAGVQAIMSRSIGAAVAYEAQMAEIRALTGATEKDTDTLTVAIKDMSRAMPKGPAELGAAAYFILSSGIEDAADAADVLKVAAKASTVGLGETETVADALTTVMNAYGMSAGEAGHVTDVMIEAVKQGKAEAGEFSGVLGRVVPIAAQMGVSFEEVAANLATFTRLGVSSEEAATGLRAVMASLLKPTKQQEEAMAELGLSAKGLRQQIKDKGLLVTLDEMMQATGGNEAAVSALFPNIRALTSVLGTAGVQMDAYKDILGATNNATGNLDEGFAIVSDTAKFKMGVAMNELNLMLMELGEEILPALVPAMKMVVVTAQTLAEAMNAIIVPVKAIAGAFDTAFGKMPTELELVTKKLKGMAAAAEITEDEFIDLAVQTGMTLDEAKKLAADTTFKTQMEVWKDKAQQFGISGEDAARMWDEAGTDIGWTASDIEGDVGNMLRKADDFKAAMVNEVAPQSVDAFGLIEGAADSARSAISEMYGVTTQEEAAAEAALASLRLEAGELELKTGDLTQAEANRLAVLKDELIPAQEDTLELLGLQKDAVLKGAEAQDAALPHMDAFGAHAELAAARLGIYSAALNAIPEFVSTHVKLTPEGFSFDMEAWFRENFPVFFPAQHGYHGDVSRPTLFMAGEAGRERVDITPGGGGGAGGGRVIHNHFHFDGPILGDHRQAMQFVEFIRPELERALT